jgi:hypothetical protein
MAKVLIRTITNRRDGETWHETELLVDGELIGSGAYGGEPEDNSYWRDYKWVEPMIESLAKKLGGEVEHVTVDAPEEP